jgi:KUP system potassium uptake protein
VRRFSRYRIGFVHVNMAGTYKTSIVTKSLKMIYIASILILGFREPTKINLMFKEVIKDMVQKGGGYYQSI